jgi:hypothetical protein
MACRKGGALAQAGIGGVRPDRSPGQPPIFRIACVLAFLCFALPAFAERIEYALYDVENGDGCRGERLLHAKGTREYSLKDVVSTDQGVAVSKWIPIDAGFVAGISIFPAKDGDGFGLWLRDVESWRGQLSGGGFSWEWFQRESGTDYRKLQCGGRVRVTFIAGQRGPEVGTVEVLEDIVLRVNNRPWFFFTSSPTHHLVIRKGSVLRFS